jgi:hypothetical protein
VQGKPKLPGLVASQFVSSVHLFFCWNKTLTLHSIFAELPNCVF